MSNVDKPGYCLAWPAPTVWATLCQQQGLPPPPTLSLPLFKKLLDSAGSGVEIPPKPPQDPWGDPVVWPPQVKLEDLKEELLHDQVAVLIVAPPLSVVLHHQIAEEKEEVVSNSN